MSIYGKKRSKSTAAGLKKPAKTQVFEAIPEITDPKDFSGLDREGEAAVEAEWSDPDELLAKAQAAAAELPPLPDDEDEALRREVEESLAAQLNNGEVDSRIYPYAVSLFEAAFAFADAVRRIEEEDAEAEAKAEADRKAAEAIAELDRRRRAEATLKIKRVDDKDFVDARPEIIHCVKEFGVMPASEKYEVFLQHPDGAVWEIQDSPEARKAVADYFAAVSEKYLGGSAQ